MEESLVHIGQFDLELHIKMTTVFVVIITEGDHIKAVFDITTVGHSLP